MGIGGALHISRTIVVILSVIVLNELQANCHCSFVNRVFCRSCVSLSMCLERLSKNLCGIRLGSPLV